MIVYTDSIAGTSSANLHGFFVGWPNSPSPATHLKILQNSDYVILAIDDSTGDVVGFVNAISDGVISAYIPLLEVLPKYQGRGIGNELMNRMLDKLGDIYMIDLMCDEKTQDFYRNFGMQKAFGMMIRNFKKQSGR